MVAAAIVALYMNNAKQAFDVIIMLGAGTGLLYILRWFWWRINAYSEITAMIVSFKIAYLFKFTDLMPSGWSGAYELLFSVGVTTFAWVVVTLVTRPTDRSTLIDFYKLIKPHDLGWKPVIKEGISSQRLTAGEVSTGKLPSELLSMFAGIFLVYSLLFTTGHVIYGNMMQALIGLVIALISFLLLRNAWVSKG